YMTRSSCAIKRAYWNCVELGPAAVGAAMRNTLWVLARLAFCIDSWRACGYPTPFIESLWVCSRGHSCCRAIRDGGALSDRCGPSSSRTVPHGVRPRHGSRLDEVGDQLGQSRDEGQNAVL